MKAIKSVVAIYIIFFISGCITVGSQRLLLSQDVTFEQYDKLKRIVVEEAALNGFSELTSEIKPSKHNEWQGQFYFKLETPHGTDQLFVELSSKNNRILGVYEEYSG